MSIDHEAAGGNPALGAAGGTTTKHLLLTVLGTNPKAACYTLGKRQARAEFAPVALLDLLREDERPDLVIALCTSEAAEKSWPKFKRALGGRCESRQVDISDGGTQEAVNGYLAQISGAIPEEGKVDLTVDVTHGLRHLSFLTYIAVLYLSALRGVRVRGAFYGLLRLDEPSPFLDLRPLLELPRWLHALETLRETGSTFPMAEILRAGPQNQSAKKLTGELSQLSEAYLSGLPIELGQVTGRVLEHSLKPLRRSLNREHHLPLADELVGRLRRILQPFALREPISGDGWKKRVLLSKDELRRQAKIIDDLLKHGNLAAALGLMNEWTVSWAVWRTTETPEDQWLDYKKVRSKAAKLLGAIAAVEENPDLADVLTTDQRSLGNFWRELSDLRNAYAHHGMRPQVLVGDAKIEKELDRVRRFWSETLRSCPELSLSLGESPDRRVLVSPIGMRPGVLFSALQACRSGDDGAYPTICLVICSHETKPLIAEATCQAGYEGAIEPIRLDDPHGGRPEIERLAKAARRHFVGATEVFVNVTGGTTLMGLAAEGLADAARKLACPVRRFGLIDRRPPQQQGADPWQTGEPFWLDSADDGDAKRE